MRDRAGPGCCVVWLCQMAAVRARSRCSIRAATPGRVRPPWRWGPSWVLGVWLMDSMIWRSGRRYRPPGRGGFCFGGGADEGDARVVELLLEAGAPVALVGNEGLGAPGDAGVGDHVQARVAFVGFRVGEGEGDGQTRRCCEQVQARAPEVPGVRGAVTVDAHRLGSFQGPPGSGAISPPNLGHPQPPNGGPSPAPSVFSSHVAISAVSSTTQRRTPPPAPLGTSQLVVGGAGLVTIWNDGGASLQFWRSVFEKRAPDFIERIEDLAGTQVGRGNTARNISEDLLSALTEAYAEAAK